MELAHLLAQLDDNLLGDLFSASALTRARSYVGRVRNLEVSGNQLQALVQGKEPVPYRVTVRIERREFFGQSNIELFARCTCPVGNRCKHAAALPARLDISRGEARIRLIIDSWTALP